MNFAPPRRHCEQKLLDNDLSPAAALTEALQSVFIGQLEFAWIHPPGNFRREQYNGPVRAWQVEQPPPQLPAVLLLERSVARAHVIPMGMAGNHNAIFGKAQLDKSIAA